MQTLFSYLENTDNANCVPISEPEAGGRGRDLKKRVFFKSVLEEEHVRCEDTWAGAERGR